eukprot:m.766706 g.766706  ORF g.766706 m.766706 type:complete len:300 (-) comp23225_c0_seq5:1812-2711(-)
MAEQSDNDRSRQAFLISEIERLNKLSENLEQEISSRFDESQAVNPTLYAVGENDAQVTDVMRVLMRVGEEATATHKDQDTTLMTDTVTSNLHMLANITGVVFKKVSAELLPPSTTKGDMRLRRHTLVGEALGLHFSVMFDVSEDAMNIQHLDIEVDPESEAELGSFVEATEKHKSPQSFFLTFVQYAELNAQRRSALHALREAHPEVISLPLGSRCGWLVAVASKRLAFSVTWRLRVGRNGRVTAGVALCPATGAAGSGGRGAYDRVIAEAPVKFGALVRLVGPEAAIEAIAKAVLAAV